MNKQVNFNLKNLNNWLNANKTFLNVGKTEVILFKSPAKLILTYILSEMGTATLSDRFS